MAIFQPVTFGWGGKDYTVPAERALGLIAEIEEVMTFIDLLVNRDKPNLSKLARAYGAALRYAGARVSDDEVYEGLFNPGKLFEEVQQAIAVLLAIMTPPSLASAVNSEADPKSGARFGGNRPAAPARSSKRSSRRRSAAAG
jgi:hypothetical protein